MTLGVSHLSSTALHSQHFLFPSESCKRILHQPYLLAPQHPFEIWSGAQQGRRNARPVLIPGFGVCSSSWSHVFKAALGKQGYCGEAKAARSSTVSGKSEGTPYESSRCPQPYSNPTDHSKYPYPQPPLWEPCMLSCGHLATSLLFGHHGPCSCQFTGRETARSWLPSLMDSITHCLESAEKVSAITCILESSPPPPMNSLPQPARPLCPASPAHWAQTSLPRLQRSRNPEVQLAGSW